jgi:ABC-type glycerol-3-phosphate transport system permease component
MKAGRLLANNRVFKFKRSALIKLLFFITALIVTVVLGMPLFYMLVSSFKPATEVYHLPPSFFPVKWTLEGYRELVELSNVLWAFRNSVFVATLAATLGVVLSVGLVYSLTRFRMPGSRLFSILSLVVYFMPGILLIIPMYTFWVGIGLQEGLIPLGVTYVSFTLPFALWMIRSYFAGIPAELEEAALVDGATRLQAFLKIVMPLAFPGIFATFIFTFILSWNEVLFATIFASGLNNQVMSSLLSNLLLEGTGWMSWGMINAAGVVATFPVLILFIIIQRQLVTGFLAGGVKG